MTILSLIQALLSLAGVVMKYASDKQLMDAGASKAAAESLLGAIDAIELAKRARAGVKHDPDSVVLDPNNRDRA